jgi:hypothetical protein
MLVETGLHDLAASFNEAAARLFRPNRQWRQANCRRHRGPQNPSHLFSSFD